VARVGIKTDIDSYGGRADLRPLLRNATSIVREQFGARVQGNVMINNYSVPDWKPGGPKSINARFLKRMITMLSRSKVRTDLFYDEPYLKGPWTLHQQTQLRHGRGMYARKRIV
jgi:hypothetical protein